MGYKQWALATVASVALWWNGAQAADKLPQVPDEVVFSVLPAENAEDTAQRYEPLAKMLADELHTKVRLSVVTDYAALIEALRNNRIQLAYMSPSAYARAYKVTQGNVMPIAVTKYKERASTYSSVLWVRADSPYKVLADVKGQNVAWVDANSASGYIAPRFFLSKEGINIDEFFGRAVMAGTHETAIFAVLNKQTEVAATWYESDSVSAYSRMVEKKVVPANALRALWVSPPLPEPPFVMAKNAAPEFVKAVQQTLAKLPQQNQALAQKIWGSPVQSISAVDHAYYVDMMSMLDTTDKLRRKR